RRDDGQQDSSMHEAGWSGTTGKSRIMTEIERPLQSAASRTLLFKHGRPVARCHLCAGLVGGVIGGARRRALWAGAGAEFDNIPGKQEDSDREDAAGSEFDAAGAELDGIVFSFGHAGLLMGVKARRSQQFR